MVLSALLGLMAAACHSAAPVVAPNRTVGFIFIGRHDDGGYNQAAWEGSVAVAKAFPDVDVLRTEDVPEDHTAVDALEALIARGATILFATSYGHLASAVEVAKRHPEVVVLHQGGLAPPERLPNLGTYWGTVFEPVSLAGIVAGGMSKTAKVGFVAAFPIPATYANLDAFQLGATSVNPAMQVRVVYTGSWCDPAAERRASEALIAWGADVLTEHQDCPNPVLETAEAAGVRSIGYHEDGSEVAPKGWLVGSVWRWGPLFTDVVRTILSGQFTGSVYNGNYRGGLRLGDNPFVLTDLAADVPPAIADRVADAKRRYESGGSPFTGPIVDQQGVTRVAAGQQATIPELDVVTWLVPGIEVTPS